jgi:stearoyl-CoA desaturase (delta-9 desaturase)
MFKMEKFWEKFFYLLLLFSQGSSFLNPRAYAILHRMHHAHSDTEKDPHSPHFFKDVFGMMIATKNMYLNYLRHKIEPEPAFQGDYPEWPLVDKIGDSWFWRLACAAGYITFYVVFATQWWMFLLLPFHFLMGPLHGAIVNWCDINMATLTMITTTKAKILCHGIFY